MTWLRRNRLYKIEQGFSLLELVVAVGIMLVLTMGGFAGFSSMVTNSRQAAVDNAVETQYNLAVSYYLDKNPQTEPHDAEEEWNAISPETANSITITVWDFNCEGPSSGTFGAITPTDDKHSNIIFGVKATNSQGNEATKYYFNPNSDNTVAKSTYNCK